MSNLYNFNGKVAIVTGSSSGIGAATAIHFAKFGGQVVITGRNKEKLQKVYDQCKKVAQEGSFKTTNAVVQVIGDVTDLEVLKKLVNTAIDSFGKIDILVNNAGFGYPTSIYDLNLIETYNNLMDTNLKSVVVLTQLAVPHLEKTKGVIVNVSSVAAMRPSDSFAICCMTKAALDMFTKCLALEVGPKGIRVNSVNPGPVKTDGYEKMNMTIEMRDKIIEEFTKSMALRRGGESEEIAKPIAFLSSDDSSFITGTTLLDDGGAMWSGS